MLIDNLVVDQNAAAEGPRSPWATTLAKIPGSVVVMVTDQGKLVKLASRVCPLMSR